MAAELWGYEQAHTRSPPHTMGNPREMERPAPLEGNGSRAQAVRGAPETVRMAWVVRDLSRPPPKTHCTRPLWSFLRVVGLREGGSTLPFRAGPGRVPWAKTRPPGARLRAPTPGLAPGWGPGDANPGDVVDNSLYRGNCSRRQQQLLEHSWTRDSLCHRGTPVKCGQTIRLTHVNTGRNLHSHYFASPLSSNQEVSAFGEEGEGDHLDEWTVQCGGSVWGREEAVRFRHRATDALLSVTGEQYGRPIQGQREVHAMSSPSQHSLWKAMEGIFMKPSDTTAFRGEHIHTEF
ncbi:hypothetical protein WMY93_009242 [Mugilogobius chulae]|uniref:MIR domain-containing protein n=1 Tax=Mugilogobius chulae TaxID=88201 RepID=A0AAW0PLM3_9GOBI